MRLSPVEAVFYVGCLLDAALGIGCKQFVITVESIFQNNEEGQNVYRNHALSMLEANRSTFFKYFGGNWLENLQPFRLVSRSTANK